MHGESEEKFSLLSFCEEAVSLLLTAYLFIIFFFYPFYIQNGYVEIGSAKFYFYKAITSGAFVLIVPLVVLSVILRYKETGSLFQTESSNRHKKLSFTDCAFLVYGVGVLLSYCFSQFKQIAVWGENGWHMGLVTQLFFILSYFLISRFWEYEGKILWVCLAASAGVFLLGLLNSFSVYPISIEGAAKGFISTLGNINWYCGYYSVLFPIGFILYWVTDSRRIKAAGALYTVLGLATGVSQGSSSVFLVIAGLYILIFCLSFSSQKRMKHFFELSILFCITCQGLRLWRILFPESYNYYDGGLSDWITTTHITLYVMIPLAVIYLLIILGEKKEYMDMSRYKMLRQITLLLLTITSGVYIMLLIWNTRTQGGLHFIGELPAFTLNRYWGSSRGGTWSAGVSIFQELPGLSKLIGAGPDCFASYLYTLPETAQRVRDQFGSSRLTNAHNEWLTVLVNNGIVGLIGYGGIFVSASVRFLRRAEKTAAGLKENPEGDKGQLFLYIFAASSFSYMIHNIVSFQQVLSTPFVFLMIGMGERLMRERKEDQRISG